MRVRIGCGGSSVSGLDYEAAELTDRFATWLAQDRSVGPHLTIDRVRTASVDGAMSGELLDWISLTLNGGFSVASLIYSHLNFRASLLPRQRRAAQMVIEHDGARLVIEAGTAEDVARLHRLLGGFGVGEGDGEGGAGDGDSDGS